MDKLKFFTATVLFLVFLAAGAAQPAPPHEVYGVVSDTSGGSAEGVTVEAMASGEVVDSDSTDSQGRYSVKVSTEYSSFDLLFNGVVKLEGVETRAWEIQRFDTVVNVSSDSSGSGGSTDGRSGGDGTGGSNGGGSSGGGGVLPGGGEDKDEENQTIEDEDGNVTVGDTEENETVVIDEEDNSSAVENVSFESPENSENVTVSLADEAPAGAGSAGQEVMDYTSVNISGYEESPSVNLTFRVSKVYLFNRNSTLEDVVIKGFNGEKWVPINSTLLKETEEAFILKASARYSDFAVTLESDKETVKQGSVSKTLRVTPLKGRAPLTTRITVILKNNGDGEVRERTLINVNGEELVKNVVLAPGEKHLLNFSYTFSEPGNYTVQLGELSKSLKVKEGGTELPSGFIAAAIIVMSVIAVYAYSL